MKLHSFCAGGSSRDKNILVFPSYMKVGPIASLERFSPIAPKGFWLKSKQRYFFKYLCDTEIWSWKIKDHSNMNVCEIRPIYTNVAWNGIILLKIYTSWAANVFKYLNIHFFFFFSSCFSLEVICWVLQTLWMMRLVLKLLGVFAQGYLQRTSALSRWLQRENCFVAEVRVMRHAYILISGMTGFSVWCKAGNMKRMDKAEKEQRRDTDKTKTAFFFQFSVWIFAFGF